jgi:hypothetical protein
VETMRKLASQMLALEQRLLSKPAPPRVPKLRGIPGGRS